VILSLLFKKKKHPHFTRDGNDLIYKRSIPLTEALCGTSFTVKGLNGETFTVDTSDEVINPHTRKRVPGKGMPIKNSSSYGDLIVEFDVQFPRKLNSNQKKKIREANL